MCELKTGRSGEKLVIGGYHVVILPTLACVVA